MTGPDMPDYAVEAVTDSPRGARTVLVRLVGGRHVRVSVPADKVSGNGMTDAVEAAVRFLPRPPIDNYGG